MLDDQPQYLRSLQRALRGEYEVLTATNPAEARRILSGDTELVLADIRLDENRQEDRQGLEFILDVRVHFPGLPIIAMSALDTPDVESTALAAGATQFLRKPIIVSKLKGLLRQLLTTMQ